MEAQDNKLPVSMEAASAAIADRCAKDPEWMAAFKANPREELQKVVGQKLPDDVQIHLHQNDTDNWHVPVPNLETELSDSDLRAIAGGEFVALAVLLGGLAVGGAVAGGVTSAGIAGGIIAADKKKSKGKK